MLGACSIPTDEVVTGERSRRLSPASSDRDQEANQSVVIFVGHGRGGLSAPQRADVMGLAQTWRREGNRRDRRRRAGRYAERAGRGGRIPRNPLAARGRRRAVAAASRCITTIRTIRGLLRGDQAELSKDRGRGRTLRPVAGRSRTLDQQSRVMPRTRQYYNFGCANQRNLAAMIDNPADLVQPRPETPAYTARRTEAFEKYRKGNSTATAYPEADKAKLSDTGK